MSLKLKTSLLLISVSLTACTYSNDDLYDFIEQTKAKHVGSVEPLPTFEPYKSFEYAAEELRDPFENVFEAEPQEPVVDNGIRPDIDRPREALEAYPLDTLRMVGILQQDNNTWGLVKDSSDTVHRVQVGNYIGQNDGHITSVTETQIDLIEIIPDGLGGYIERAASLAIGSE